MVRGPRSEVFTTMLVDAHGRVADWAAHWNRLQRHGRRLRIDLPEPDWEHLRPHAGPEGTLGRLSFIAEDGTWSWEQRQRGWFNESVEAITHPAPRWTPKVNGTKHGDWAPYRSAKAAAESAGCDVALLIHNHAIVDADRATPMLLDEDGTVWLPSSDEGGVQGIVAEHLAERLPSAGYPVQRGRLNERLVARCRELVVVGTGLGVARVDAVDGEPMGSFNAFSAHLQTVLSEHYSQPATWESMRPNDEQTVH